MKTTSFFFLLLLSMLTACMNPLPSDFKGKKTLGLTEDEVLISWRLSKDVNSQESLDMTAEDSALARQYVAPFFDQLIPRLFKDIENKKLSIYEYVDMGQPSEKQLDIQTQIEALNGGKTENPLAPFSYKIHFDINHPKQNKNLEGEFIDMMLIWYDVKQLSPEKILGIIKMRDLHELGYTIDMNSKSYPLDEYVREFCAYKIYPVRFRTVDNEQGLQTLEEAFYLKEKVLAGQWNNLSWVKVAAEELNISGKKPIELSEEKLNQFVGIYAFPPQGSQSDSSFLEIKLEQGFLVPNWSESSFFSSEFFPSSEKEIFTRHGSILTWMEDGQVKFKPYDSTEEKEMLGVKLE